MTEPIDHPVSRYAIDVVEGREVAGELVTLACERHLRDLETGADRGFWFDTKAADAIVKFARLLQHTEGRYAGQPFELQPWQVFRQGSVFGWKREDGLRRFRDTYHQVGKKNGKTTETAVPMLYTQLLDDEAAPQGFCAATTRDQAGILFRGIKRVLRHSFLGGGFNTTKTTIESRYTDGFIACLSRDGNSSDGINPHFLARDEMHRWEDRELAETIVQSMIAREQPIDWVITTAGHDRQGTICGELRDYAESVLRGQIEDDRFFAYVAEPHQTCDPMDPRAWKMANPNLGVSKPVDELRATVKRASIITGEMPNVRRFHLNLWTSGAEDWIDRGAWDGGDAAQRIDIESLYGRKAWLAIDLSNTLDLTAIAVAVPVDGLMNVIVYSFLPEGPNGFLHRAQTEKREYIAWKDQRWLEVHTGGAIDEELIAARILWLKQRFQVQEVAYDPWRMKNLAESLEKRGLPMVEHRQGFASMSNPMKTVEELVVTGRLRHGGNPVLTWAVGNVHRDEDPAENIKPTKKKSRGRIDPAVAMIMAVGRAKLGHGRTQSREVETL